MDQTHVHPSASDIAVVTTVPHMTNCNLEKNSIAGNSSTMSNEDAKQNTRMRTMQQPTSTSATLDEKRITGVGATAVVVSHATVSKNQLKRQLRWEKKIEINKRRKIQEKEVKEAKARAAGRDLVIERKEQAANFGKNIDRNNEQWQREKQALLDTSFEVCIDCSFEEWMTPKEINSLAIQLRYCYSINKKNKHPCRLAVTSVQGATLRHLQAVSGFDQWSKRAFTVTSESLEDYYGGKDDKNSSSQLVEQVTNDNDNNNCENTAVTSKSLDRIVYLTADSDNVLSELDDSKTYVLGGIVDRNRLKQATINRANTLQVATARLPIDEHLKMESTRVLTVNTVFALLLQYREYNGDWQKALLNVVPRRKDPHVLTVNESNAVEDDTNDP